MTMILVILSEANEIAAVGVNGSRLLVTDSRATARVESGELNKIGRADCAKAVLTSGASPATKRSEMSRQVT